MKRFWSVSRVARSVVLIMAMALLSLNGAGATAAAQTFTAEIDAGSTALTPVVDGDDVTVSFDGEAGQLVSIRLEGLDGAKSVVDPSGAEIATAPEWSSAFLRLPLPSTGTFQVVVEDVVQWDWAEPSIRVSSVLDVGGELPVGQPPVEVGLGEDATALLDVVDVPADDVSFLISLPPEENLDGLYQLSAQLLDSDGEPVADAVFDGRVAFIDAVPLLSAESYHLRLETPDWQGVLQVQAFAVPETVDIVAAVGADTVVNLEVPGTDARVSFPVVAGSRYSVSVKGLPEGARPEVVDPDGSTRWDWPRDGLDENEPAGVMVAPDSGTMALTIHGGATTGKAHVRVHTIPTTDPHEDLLIDGPAKALTSTVTGQPMTWTFPVDARQTYRVSVKGDDTPGRFEVYDSDGNLRGNNSFAAGTWTSDYRSTVYVDDTITIVASPSSPGTVRARVHLVDPAEASGAYSGTLTADSGTIRVPDTDGEWWFEAAVTEGVEYHWELDTNEPMVMEATEYASYQWHGSQVVNPGQPYTFTATSTGTVSLSAYSAAQGHQSEPSAGLYATELYTSLGAPIVTLDVDEGSVNTARVAVALKTRTAGRELAGYAVSIDTAATTDPGTQVNRVDPSFEATVDPGQNWLHVRGVLSDGTPGPLTHVLIEGDNAIGAGTISAPTVTPGSPGWVTSANPTITATPLGPVPGGVRFVVRGQGRRIWSATSSTPTSAGTYAVTLPEDLLTAGVRYSAEAQGLDVDGAASARGVPTEFVFDSAAPVTAPTPTCGWGCHSVDEPVLSEASIEANQTVTVSVQDLVDDDEDWVGYAVLEVASTTAADLTVTTDLMTSDVPATPTTPTVRLSGGQSSTMMVYPDATGAFQITNSGATDATVTVRAIGWISGYTPALRMLDDQAEEAATILEENNTDVGYAIPVQGDDGPVPESDCAALGDAEVATCTVPIVPPTQAEPSTPPTDAGTAAFRSQRLAADPSCSSIAAANRWVYVDRHLACRAVGIEADYVEKRFGLFVETGAATVRIEQYVRTRWNSTEVTWSSRTTRMSSRGAAKGRPLTILLHHTCLSPACRNNPGLAEHSTTSDGTSSKWDRLNTTTSVTRGFPNYVDEYGGELTVQSAYLGAVPSPGTTYSFIPEFRCDNEDEVQYRKRPIRTQGCVYPQVLTVAQYPWRYREHAALVARGQNVLANHPGSPPGIYNVPLTRWNSKPDYNRQLAQKMCKDLGFTLTCDEYPYNATLQGCQYAPLTASRSPGCVVADMPKDINSGANGVLIWFQRKNRILIGDDYYVQPTPLLPVVQSPN